MLQRFFEYLDKVLGITNIPYLFIALVPLIIFVTVLILIFWNLESRRSDSHVATESKRKRFSEILLLIYFTSICCAMVEVLKNAFASLFTGSIIFIIAKIVAMATLFFTGLTYERRYLALYCLSSYLFIILSSLENNLAMQIHAGETIVDTINIYDNGHWCLSYHNPVYDALPYDSVLSVFLMYILNISDPTSIFPKILIDESCSLLLACVMVMFARRSKAERCCIPLALFTLSLPYLTLEIPPLNLSIVFVALVIFMVFKMLNRRVGMDGLLLLLFFGCGILAHSQSVQVLIPLMIIGLFFEFKRFWHSEIDKTNGIRFSHLIITCVIIYAIYLAYTAALEATYEYIRSYVTLRLTGVLTSPSNAFTNVPNSVKLFYTPPLAPSLAWLGCYLLRKGTNLIRGRRSKFFREISPYNMLIFVLCISELIAGMISAYSLFGGRAVNKHLAILAYVYGAFAAFPAFVLAFDKPCPTKLAKLLLLVTLLFITVGGFLTPHRMFGQYVWPPLHNKNDYRTSEWLVNHGIESASQQYNLTMVITGRSSPTLYISVFRRAVTNQLLPRYPRLSQLERVSIIRDASRFNLGNLSPSKIYDTLDYEVYF